MKTLLRMSLSPETRPTKCVSVSSATGGGRGGGANSNENATLNNTQGSLNGGVNFYASESELSLNCNPERWGDESRGDGVPDNNLEVPISVGGLKVCGA